MPLFSESPRSQANKQRNVIPLKYGRSNSDMVLNSPRSKRLSASEDSDVPESSEIRDNNTTSTTGLMTKIRQGFSLYKPIEHNGLQGGKNATTPKELKLLSPAEAKTLSEFGKHLSEKNDDHQGAIVTLMRALKSQISSSQGKLNKDCATTLTYMGDVYMRRGESSKDDQGASKDAKRAEFCFSEALDVYRYYNEKRNIAKLNKKVNAAKRLQLKKRRVVSFSLLAQREHSQSTISISSSDSSDIDYDKTVVSDITWMDAYNTEYYKKQHLLFLEKQHNESRLLDFFETGMCSYFCRGPPVNTIEFVEKELDM